MDLSVDIGSLRLSNPLIAASGCYGYGVEYADAVDLSTLGAVASKGLFLAPREGHPPQRIVETPSGMLLQAIRKLDNRVAIVVFSGTIANADEVRQLETIGVLGYVNEYTAVHHILPSLLPHLFPKALNRRSSPRVALGIPIAYRFGNTIAAALTINISHGGLSIRTTNPLTVDTPVKVRFRLPNGTGEIEAQGRVAWADRRLGMGVRFTKIDEPEQAQIDDYVHSHFFSNRKA